MSKKIVVFLLLIIVLIFSGIFGVHYFQTASDQNQVHKQQKKNYKIVAIGDSLTEGVGDEKNKGYVGTTVDHLKQKNNVKKVAFVDFGHRGDTSADLLQVLKRSEVRQQIKQSNVVFLTIGANDLVHVLRTHFLNLKEVYFTEQEHVFIVNFNDILEQIRKLNPKTNIYFFGLYNPFEDYMGSSNNKLVGTLKDWNHQSEVTLKKYPHTTFIPTYDIFYGKNDTLLYKDHFHPNAKGYTLLSKRLVKSMARKD